MFVDPANRYTVADRLLEAIEVHTHAAWWKDTKDAKHGRNRPKPVGLSKPKKPENRNAMFVEDYAAFLALPREEVRVDASGASIGLRDDNALAEGGAGADIEPA